MARDWGLGTCCAWPKTDCPLLKALKAHTATSPDCAVHVTGGVIAAVPALAVAVGVVPAIAETATTGDGPKAWAKASAKESAVMVLKLVVREVLALTPP